MKGTTMNTETYDAADVPAPEQVRQLCYVRDGEQSYALVALHRNGDHKLAWFRVNAGQWTRETAGQAAAVDVDKARSEINWVLKLFVACQDHLQWARRAMGNDPETPT